MHRLIVGLTDSVRHNLAQLPIVITDNVVYNIDALRSRPGCTDYKLPAASTTHVPEFPKLWEVAANLVLHEKRWVLR